jgi:uncharacterized protein (TIGR02145 family)
MKKTGRIRLIILIIFGLILIQVTSCRKDEPLTVTDIDGNTYTAVTIGKQVWMAENLKTTKLKDKTAITLVTGSTTWTTTTRPAFCWYNNDTVNKALYGGLYNWFTVETGKLCPSGWHVPNHEEYKTMEKSLGMTQAEADAWGWRGVDQGKKLKNTTGWDSNGNGSNSSGFSALAGGYRYGVSGAFFDIGKLSYWWTSTKSNTNLGYYRRLDNNQTKVYAEGVKLQAGKYVRCVKDSI